MTLTSENIYWKWIVVKKWFCHSRFIRQFLSSKNKSFSCFVVACLGGTQSSFWGGRGLIGDLEAAPCLIPDLEARLQALCLPVKWVNSLNPSNPLIFIWQKKMYKKEFNHISFWGSNFLTFCSVKLMSHLCFSLCFSGMNIFIIHAILIVQEPWIYENWGVTPPTFTDKFHHLSFASDPLVPFSRQEVKG